MLSSKNQESSTQKKVKIGILSPKNNKRYDIIISTMKAELPNYGYAPEYIQEDASDSSKFQSIAQDYVDMNVDVIVTNATSATKAVQKATSSIPIVFGSVGDPVANGIVSSLDSSGSNITGITSLSVELTPKRLDLLKSIKPNLSSVYFVDEPTDISSINAFKAATVEAQNLGINLIEKGATTSADVDKISSQIKASEAGAIIGYGTNLVVPGVAKLIAAQNRERIPFTSTDRSIAEAGGIFSYAPEYVGLGKQLASLVNQVLKGTKPQFIPVQRPDKLELVINKSAAAGIGLTIPDAVLSKADIIIP